MQRKTALEGISPTTDAAAAVVKDDLSSDLDAIANNALVPTMLETVCLATGLRFAAVARVTESRWITCSSVDHLAFGLKPGDELAVEKTLCHEVRLCESEIVINDVLTDELYQDHPTPSQYGFRSYLSIPVYWPDGRFFGTLCAFDPEPNQLNGGRVLGMARMFARMIGDSLEQQLRLQNARHALTHERELAEVQEQFIAILAHDLRNPLAAVRAGLRTLGRDEVDPGKVQLIKLIEATGHRMTELLNNLLDHARNRLAGGIILNRNSDAPLADILEQVIAEFRAISTTYEIKTSIDLPSQIDCDRPRIAQLLSNLVGNAMTHGAADRPIHVVGQAENGVMSISVANEGPPIPAAALPKLFQPFQRAQEHSSRSGLGLGLYIASEIAKAHGGFLGVSSTSARTVFTFEMPLNRAR